MSFFQLWAKERLKHNQLMNLHQMLDWSRIDRQLVKIHKRDWTHGGGPIPYDPLQMPKAVLLAHWHQLSDQGLIDSLSVRLDLMLFTGFDLDSLLPEGSSVCRFRNRLSDLQPDRLLFEEINAQRGVMGLAIQEADTAVVDATIIQSANRPRRCLEVVIDVIHA